MNIDNEFISIDNKRLLWDLLLKNNVFSNIPTDKEQRVKHLFENNIASIEIESKSEGSQRNLAQLNKLFISKIVLEMNKLKTVKKTVSFDKNTDLKPISKPELSDRNIITAEKQHQIRQTEFNKQLEGKQQEFSNMINADTPSKIDFSDSPEEQHITDMDDRIATMMSSRESDIKTLFNDKPPPSKIINKSETVKTQIIKNNTHQNTKQRLQIGNNIRIADIILLHTTPIEPSISNKDVMNMLREMSDVQNTIVERLNTIKIL